jgi:hypothetical protein
VTEIFLEIFDAAMTPSNCASAFSAMTFINNGERWKLDVVLERNDSGESGKWTHPLSNALHLASSNRRDWAGHSNAVLCNINLFSVN